MPENWNTYKLKEVANLSTGFAFKSKDYRNTGDLKVIRGKNITEGYLRWGDDSRYWNFSMEKLDKYVVKEGDIVVGMDGSKIGKNRAIVRSQDLPSILAQRVGRINAKSKIAEQKFLWQLINNKIFEEYIDNVKTGTSIPHISLTQIGNFEIKLPPLQEQKSIASILSALDNKIELNLQMNKTLEKMAIALYKHWFVDFGPFQDGEFVDSELGEIPKGWEVKLLDEVVDLIIDHRGKTPKKLGGDWSNLSEDCIEAISAKNIKAGKIVKPETIKYISRDLFKKWMKEPLQDKDILLTSEAPIGEYYLILNKTDYCLSQRLFGIRSNPHILRPELLYCFLTSNVGQNQLLSRGSGSTVQGIKQSELRKLNIMVPTQEDQIPISEKLLSLYGQMRNNDEENQTFTQLRDTLLPKLISGEVRVKDVEKTLSEVL